MNRAAPPPAIPLALEAPAVGVLMPMFLWLDRSCRIRAAGPTLHKIIRRPFIGAGLTSVFQLRRPAGIRDADDLVRANRIRLGFSGPPATGFKGVAVPMAAGDGVLINLSFGYGVHDAVRDHGLSDTDFAATDLAIELLYLLEAKNAVMAELDKTNHALRGAKQEAEAQALTDALTGLGNRRALERAMALHTASGRAFGLMQMDLDHFKAVNDTLGHAAGDHVLSVVARVLRETVRHHDLVARVGGDEFVILLHGLADLGPIRRIGLSLLERLAEPIFFEGQRCAVSASLGAVLQCPPPHERDAETLLTEADRALYLSKNAGRSRLTMIDVKGRAETIPDTPCPAEDPMALPGQGDEPVSMPPSRPVRTGKTGATARDKPLTGTP